jgi:type IV secretory pathway TraG/TraD family ATPase VirD4
VHVFNPYEVGRVPSSFGWDVVSGCENPAEAFIRADAIIGPRTETGDMAWWQDKAAIALAALLHAAALSGRTVLDIWDWANRQGDAIAGSALAGHPAASRPLRSVFAEATREGRSPDSIRMTMAKSLTWVADPAVAAMVHGPAARPFDADGAQGATIAPLFRCFTDYVQRQATLAGSRRPEGKLDPPLLLALDEARQIVRVPLDLWLADSAGKGICIVAVAHGLGQLREGWGADGAATIWDTTNKIILPGVTDRECLDTIQDICGTVGATEGDRRVQVPAVPAAFVRRLPRRRALILEGDLAPVVVKTRPVWARLRSRLRLAVAPPVLDAATMAVPDDLEALDWVPRGGDLPAPWPTVPGGLPRLGGPGDDRTEDPAA